MSNYQRSSESKLVYSTDTGRIKEETAKPELVGDGNVRVRPEKKGRGGKSGHGHQWAATYRQ